MEPIVSGERKYMGPSFSQPPKTPESVLQERLEFIDRQFYLASSLICDAETTYDRKWAKELGTMIERLTESLEIYLEKNPVDLDMICGKSAKH